MEEFFFRNCCEKNQIKRQSYTGNGTTTVYNIPPFSNIVYVSTDKTLNIEGPTFDYTYNYSSGEVVFIGAPVLNSPIIIAYQ